MISKKNWLIRTKDFQILGPVSKEKIIELLNNGSFNPQDEVCSGSGYWFFLKEKDLVDKFLFGDEVQPFNPVIEAKDVLTAGFESKIDAPKPREENVCVPSQEDLEYPSMPEADYPSDQTSIISAPKKVPSPSPSP